MAGEASLDHERALDARDKVLQLIEMMTDDGDRAS